MEFIFAMIFGAFVSNSVQVTLVQKDCIGRSFEPKACEMSKLYYDLGKK